MAIWTTPVVQTRFVSARAARGLRERVAGTRDLALWLDGEALLNSVGPEARLEAEPGLYVRGMLTHEGLTSHGGDNGHGPVELRLGSRHAVAGAWWTTAGAAAVATIGLWVYGLLVAATGATVAWALRRWAAAVPPSSLRASGGGCAGGAR